MTADSFFSRLEAAGHDPAVLWRGCVLVIGGGAGGTNAIQPLAMMGLRELLVCDFDKVEAHNLPHSPLLRPEDVGRNKAEVLAERFVECSRAEAPVARYAPVPFEALGWGAFRQVGCVICAVDSFGLRADVADIGRRMGTPLVELGFLAPEGQVSVWQNNAPEAPCWRCLHPRAQPQRFGCRDIARLLAERGFGASTQTVAGAVGSIAAEATVRALHGKFELDGCLLFLNVREGSASRVRAVCNPGCKGVHRRIGEILPLAARPDEPLLRVFDELGRDATVRLPWPFVRRAPCKRCGARVDVGLPTWAVQELPCCPQGCPKDTSRRGGEAVSDIRVASALAELSCQTLGLGPGAVFEARAGGRTAAYQLAGSPLDLFTTVRRHPDPDKSDQAAITA